MTKVILHPAIKCLRGKMGRVVFRILPSGETTMIKRADMTKVKWSPAQKAQRIRFKQASKYATAALSDPKVRKIYEKKAKKARKRPRNLAISDFFKGKDLLSKK